MDDEAPKVRKRDMRRTTRRQATAAQRQVLEPASARSWREMSSEEKDALRQETGLSDKRIIQFIQNRRARAKRRAGSDPGPLMNHASLPSASSEASTSGPLLPPNPSRSSSNPFPSTMAVDANVIPHDSARAMMQIDPRLRTDFHVGVEGSSAASTAADIPVPQYAHPRLNTRSPAAVPQEDFFARTAFDLDSVSTSTSRDSSAGPYMGHRLTLSSARPSLSPDNPWTSSAMTSDAVQLGSAYGGMAIQTQKEREEARRLERR